MRSCWVAFHRPKFVKFDLFHSTPRPGGITSAVEDDFDIFSVSSSQQKLVNLSRRFRFSSTCYSNHLSKKTLHWSNNFRKYVVLITSLCLLKKKSNFSFFSSRFWPNFFRKDSAGTARSHLTTCVPVFSILSSNRYWLRKGVSGCGMEVLSRSSVQTPSGLAAGCLLGPSGLVCCGWTDCAEWIFYDAFNEFWTENQNALRVLEMRKDHLSFYAGALLHAGSSRVPSASNECVATVQPCARIYHILYSPSVQRGVLERYTYRCAVLESRSW